MPYPDLLCPEPLPLKQSTADLYLLRKHSNTDLSQSLWGLWVLYIQGMFGPSELPWRVWGLILNMISPLLLSFWGFSFALGCGLSPQSHSSATQRCSSAYCLAGASLPLDVGYLLTATLASLPPHHHLLSFWASVPLDVGYFVGEKTKTQKDYILSNVTY